MKVSEADTKTLILDAAEQAFAERGFEAASLRHIIAEAGVNLAAIHYHYGSKEALISAVFARRLGPLNQERLAWLDRLEQEAGKKALPVEKVIEALVAPALRMACGPGNARHVVMRLFGRTLAEPSEALQRVLHQQFGDVVKRFTAAFRRAMPALPGRVLALRMQFVIGAMAHVMCDPENHGKSARDLCNVSDTETVLREMVAFLAAGMRAPLTGANGRKKQ